MLTRVHEPDAAVRWGEALNAWHGRWKRMLAERTYAKDNPDDPRAATSRGGWWWTHLPLRRAYFRLERLFKDGTLFVSSTPSSRFSARCRVTATGRRRPNAAPQTHARQPPRASRGTHAPRLRMAPLHEQRQTRPGPHPQNNMTKTLRTPSSTTTTTNQPANPPPAPASTERIPHQHPPPQHHRLGV